MSVWGHAQEYNARVNGENRLFSLTKEYYEEILPKVVTYWLEEQELTEETLEALELAEHVTYEWKIILPMFECIEQDNVRRYIDTGWAYDKDDPRNRQYREFLNDNDLATEFGDLPEFARLSNSEWEEQAEQSLALSLEHHKARVASDHVSTVLNQLEPLANRLAKIIGANTLQHEYDMFVDALQEAAWERSVGYDYGLD